jgi:hypothetical protein
MWYHDVVWHCYLWHGPAAVSGEVGNKTSPSHKRMGVFFLLAELRSHSHKGPQIFVIFIRSCFRMVKVSYKGSSRMNLPSLGKRFLWWQYFDITESIYIRSWTFTEKMARYILKNDTFIHLLINQYVLKLREVEVLAMLTSVLNS